MTDRRIEQEIAKKLGWTVKLWGDSFKLLNPEGGAVADLHKFTEREAWMYVPSYLTNRNAAQEIVAHFNGLRRTGEANSLLAAKFAIELCGTAGNEFWIGICATPRRICDAACKVRGLEISNG